MLCFRIKLEQMTIESIEKNLKQLPEHLLPEVSDFVEFLLLKYQSPTGSVDLPEHHKRILDERLKRMQENPSKGKSWDVLQKEFKQKYAI